MSKKGRVITLGIFDKIIIKFILIYYIFLKKGTIELSHEKKIVSSSLYPCLKTIEIHLNRIFKKNGEYEFLKRALDGMMEKF